MTVGASNSILKTACNVNNGALPSMTINQHKKKKKKLKLYSEPEDSEA